MFTSPSDVAPLIKLHVTSFTIRHWCHGSVHAITIAQLFCDDLDGSPPVKTGNDNFKMNFCTYFNASKSSFEAICIASMLQSVLVLNHKVFNDLSYLAAYPEI